MRPRSRSRGSGTHSSTSGGGESSHTHTHSRRDRSRDEDGESVSDAEREVDADVDVDDDDENTDAVDLHDIEIRHHEISDMNELSERSTLVSDSRVSVNMSYSRRSSFQEAPVGTVLYFIFAYPILVLASLFVASVCWLFIFFIPISKMCWSLITDVLSNDILGAEVTFQRSVSNDKYIELVCYTAANRYYYKYSVFGMNIILVNMLFFVGMTLLGGFVPSAEWREKNSVPLFFCSLLSVIPLAYYIGKAISSISAQTSFAVGAVLNATFGSIVELTLYFFSLRQNLVILVQKAVTGSLLGMLLLLPGLSMVAGGLRSKLQRFNRYAAGVSGALLLLAIIGAFTPTFFYMLYGNYDLKCAGCPKVPLYPVNGTLVCDRCQYVEREVGTDPIYNQSAKPLMYLCAIVLPFAYIVGLLFTLKTHSHLYEKLHEDHDGEIASHGDAEWSNLKCTLILLVSTVLYAMVSETMTDAIQPALKTIGISEDFAGLTIIALVPNVAEMVNAVQFALQDNITLSLEIGNVAAIQIAMIQLPVLVLLSVVMGLNFDSSFTLIFHRQDVICIIFSVIIINYICQDGRSNYFTGASLVLTYVIIIASFYYIPVIPNSSL